MKKLVIGLSALALVLSIGTASVFAAGNGTAHDLRTASFVDADGDGGLRQPRRRIQNRRTRVVGDAADKGQKGDTMRSESEVNRAIERYADTVNRICILHLKNRADTEDIFQTVF